MAQKSQFIIKAIPTSDLELLLAMVKRSKKQIELTVRAPTLSLKQVPSEFINSLTSLNHLRGLDISEWDLPMAAQTKLVQMTNLEQLTIGSNDINLAPLFNLTKLAIKSIDKYPQMLQSLTNLQDLTLFNLSDHLNDVIALTKLTRLHFGVSWSLSMMNAVKYIITLTALTELKILKIDSLTHTKAAIQLHASSTKLEELDIDVSLRSPDFDWIASNTRLTKFHVRFHTRQTDEWHPLTKLTQISTMALVSVDQAGLFTALKNLTELKFEQLYHEDSELIGNLTSLQVLQSYSYSSVAFPNADAMRNITRITWLPFSVTKSSFPMNVQELSTTFSVENLSSLTRLESLTIMKPLSLNMDASEMVHLTKIWLLSVEEQHASVIIPKLSNLFTLRELSVTTPNNYQGLDADFLTTLTNLEALIIPSLNIPVQVFDKIIDLHSRLTQLRISCSESNGEILTRLTNLQVLEFYSTKPINRLKILLEEKMPRLIVEVRVN